VLATANRAKAREMAALLSGIPFRILHLADFPGVTLPPEGESSSAENALGKARAVAAATGELALADDSGIEVDALGGAPGPRSARFAGEHASERENLDRLIELIRDVPLAGRGARYRCVAVLAVPDGTELVAEGVCEGTLLTEPRGLGGFGYDPIFVPSGERKTMAELPADEKDRISHRGRALRSLAAQLRTSS